MATSDAPGGRAASTIAAHDPVLAADTLEAIRAYLERWGIDTWEQDHNLNFGTAEIPRIIRLQNFGRALEAEIRDARFILRKPKTDVVDLTAAELDEHVAEYVRTHGLDQARVELSVWASLAGERDAEIAVDRFLDRY